MTHHEVNTLESYIELRKKFEQDEEAQKQLACFKAGNDDDTCHFSGKFNHTTDVLENPGLIGMKIPPIGLKIPIFTKFVEDYKQYKKTGDAKLLPATFLYGNDKFIIVMNRESPYPEQYPPQNAGTAGMSFIHMLALPLDRIYNAVALTPDDVPLIKEMMVAAKKLFETQRSKLYEVVYGSVNSKMTGTNVLANDPAGQVTIYKRFIEDEFKADKSTPNDIEFFFHPHPFHSVGHLHMHCLLSTTLTGFKNHAHKNLPANAVLDYLTSLKAPSKKIPIGIASKEKIPIMTKDQTFTVIGNNPEGLPKVKYGNSVKIAYHDENGDYIKVSNKKIYIKITK